MNDRLTDAVAALDAAWADAQLTYPPPLDSALWACSSCETCHREPCAESLADTWNYAQREVAECVLRRFTEAVDRGDTEAALVALDALDEHATETAADPAALIGLCEVVRQTMER